MSNDIELMDKNRTIIILGNGFDLDIGWKSSYNDFYRAKWLRFWKLNRMPFRRKRMVICRLARIGFESKD